MPSTIALPSPTERSRRLTYESLPEFGDYIYSPESWTQRRQWLDGRPLLLCGRGRKPSEEQVALFLQIDERLLELTTLAVNAVDAPPIQPPSSPSNRLPQFSRDELVLREVRIEKDLAFALFFDTPTGDAIDMWPMVTFTDWRVRDSEWVC